MGRENDFLARELVEDDPPSHGYGAASEDDDDHDSPSPRCHSVWVSSGSGLPAGLAQWAMGPTGLIE